MGLEEYLEIMKLGKPSLQKYSIKSGNFSERSGSEERRGHRFSKTVDSTTFGGLGLQIYNKFTKKSTSTKQILIYIEKQDIFNIFCCFLVNNALLMPIILY